MRKKYRIKSFNELIKSPKIIYKDNPLLGEYLQYPDGKQSYVDHMKHQFINGDTTFVHDFKLKDFININGWEIEEWMCEDLDSVTTCKLIKFTSKEEMAQAIIKYGKLYYDTEILYLYFDVENYPTQPFRLMYTNKKSEPINGLWNYYNDVFYIDETEC